MIPIPQKMRHTMTLTGKNVIILTNINQLNVLQKYRIMEFEMYPKRLLAFADKMSNKDDDFSRWSSSHIKNELSRFLYDNPEIRHNDDFHMPYLFLPWEEKESYLNYDGYWMVHCRSEIELNGLLKSWYEKK